MTERICEDLSFARIEAGAHGRLVDAARNTASSEEVVSEVFVR